MKKHMLLNMFMVFGVMQTSGLFCMNKLTKIIKPTNMRQSAKLNILPKQNFGKMFNRYKRITLKKWKLPRLTFTKKLLGGGALFTAAYTIYKIKNLRREREFN